MRKIYTAFILAALSIFAACGGLKPNVQAVALTEPWLSIKFPCKGDAVVVVSNESRFNCAYGGTWSKENDLKTITPYVELLKNSGWKLKDQSKQGNTYLLEKNDREIVLFPTDPSINVEQGTIQWDGFGIQAEYRKKGE